MMRKMMATPEHPFEFSGSCPCCDRASKFYSDDPWFRDHLVCEHCRSIPRERALCHVIEMLFPTWREFAIHESSPVARGASAKLSTVAGYLASRFLPEVPLGLEIAGAVLNQDLERQTFADESFDLVVTQDVMEHIFDIDLAFLEIGRTLKPGGAHVFTTPLVNGTAPTSQRARREADGSITHFFEPEYHGNPVDPAGSLVTWHFGFDIADRIHRVSNLPTTIYHFDRIDLGIRAEYIEVLVSTKYPRTENRGDSHK